MDREEKALLSELDTDMVTTKGFRIRNVTLHLTYPRHLEPEVLKKFVERQTGRSIVLWSIVNETGEKTGHLHCHALLRFDRPVVTQNARMFDFETAHPNIKKVTNNTHFANIVKYHQKQGQPDTNVDLQALGAPRPAPSPQEIWACENVQTMLTELYSSVPGARAGVFIYGLRPEEMAKEPEVQWRPWQKKLLDELEETPDDRTIKWYWDPTGSSGKSFFTKHMGMYRGAFVTTRANAYNLATTLQNFIQGKKVVVVIFNFTRQCEEHKVYEAIEQCKDGMITSEKYNGKTMMFQSPHVVVMANYLPLFDKCTLDRWVVRYLQNGDVAWTIEETWLKSAASAWMARGLGWIPALQQVRLDLQNRYTPAALFAQPLVQPVQTTWPSIGSARAYGKQN
jgi:hypothetical protein